MADLTEADLKYLRNINTRPGPGVGQSIDPTQPGPTADRIAELKREIASCDWHINEIQADLLGVDQMALGGAIATRDRLRAELSRLRNEPSPAPSPNPAGVYGTAQSPTMRDLKPSPSSGPQDVREAFIQVLASLVDAVSLLKNGGKAAKKAAASDRMFDQMILDYENAIEQGRAALVQSDAQPPSDLLNDAQPAAREISPTHVICPNCCHDFRAISQADRAALAQSDEQPVPTPSSAGLIEAAEHLTASADHEPRNPKT